MEKNLKEGISILHAIQPEEFLITALFIPIKHKIVLHIVNSNDTASHVVKQFVTQAGDNFHHSSRV